MPTATLLQESLIPLATALRLIEEASAILLPDESRALTHPSIGEITGDPDTEVLTLEWTDEMEEVSKTFMEGDNAKIKIGNGGLQMIDTCGELITLHLNRHMTEEEIKKECHLPENHPTSLPFTVLLRTENIPTTFITTVHAKNPVEAEKLAAIECTKLWKLDKNPNSKHPNISDLQCLGIAKGDVQFIEWNESH